MVSCIRNQNQNPSHKGESQSRNWKRLGVLVIVLALAAGSVFYVTGRNRAAAQTATQLDAIVALRHE
jgi:uncharacterized protein HemX